jgi:hypothetical protein
MRICAQRQGKVGRRDGYQPATMSANGGVLARRPGKLGAHNLSFSFRKSISGVSMPRSALKQKKIGCYQKSAGMARYCSLSNVFIVFLTSILLCVNRKTCKVHEQ